MKVTIYDDNGAELRTFEGFESFGFFMLTGEHCEFIAPNINTEEGAYDLDIMLKVLSKIVRRTVEPSGNAWENSPEFDA